MTRATEHCPTCRGKFAGGGPIASHRKVCRGESPQCRYCQQRVAGRRLTVHEPACKRRILRRIAQDDGLFLLTAEQYRTLVV